MRKLIVLLILVLPPFLISSGGFLFFMPEGQVSSPYNSTKLPNIDRDECLRYLLEGECVGAEIPEYHFTFWICKPEED